MKLKEMQQRIEGTLGWYMIPVADDQGAEDFDLTINGEPRVVETILKDSEFEIVISQTTSVEDAKRRAEDVWKKYARRATEPFAPIDLNSLTKMMRKSSPVMEKGGLAKNSIVVTLRRVRGEGTVYLLYLPLSLKRNQSVVVVMPHAVYTYGAVEPVSGDPDIYLHADGGYLPVASSTMGGMAKDRVDFTTAGMIVPFYRILGYTETVFASFFFSWRPLPF